MVCVCKMCCSGWMQWVEYMVLTCVVFSLYYYSVYKIHIYTHNIHRHVPLRTDVHASICVVFMGWMG